MKTSKTILAILAIAVTFAFTSCNNEDEIPGTGEGKLGLAFVLNNSTASAANARIKNSNLTIENGFIQIKELELEVEGQNDIGSFEKEIEIKFRDIRKVSFNDFDESVDFFINIEAGEYKEIELELDLIDYRNEPSIYIEGTYASQGGAAIPVVFEYYGDDIDFEVEIEAKDGGYFTIDARNNPLALFEINAVNWFRGVSDSKFENATLTDGVMLIKRDSNREIYSRITRNIKEFADIEIELRR
ncbi:hypothetical protein [Cecembia lonarensis]|uniref:DUF4382 domain-containing protein n=1 Tax=Cecembia lonarensis (strain CCUG 58316 / KCTC 22772 / LW9) TaxID=1225176 RepID=K1L1P2_CECL9|nr:hypothetical protein [Cecembia lonarensis]EKB48686.1 hypothetical protein B879_02713 [Cecembia lonarensis LW9]